MREPMGQGRRLGAALAVVVGALLGAAAPAVAAAPAPGPAFAGLPREVQHEVARGQDLHLIAGYYYGDARRWELLWQANRDAIKNPNRLRPGMVLRIPVDRDWKQDLSFADWLKIGGTLRERAPAGAPPRAAPPGPPAPAEGPGAAPAPPPAPGAPAPSRGAPPAKRPPAPPAKKPVAASPGAAWAPGTA